MPSSSRSHRGGVWLLLAATLAGLGFALYAYITPLTGVTGTIGALIVIIATIALGLAALALLVVAARGPRNVLRLLILLGLAGTAFAGLLLHQWWIAGAMGVGLIGLIIDMTRRAGTARPAQV